ncbi:protein translocase subunit SecD [Pseudolysobacter antarcticus]|uniref:Protein translocase subunit SecD n=1 Tax=Pseudolysobacter antarcticus TaxID=2511995 RepID=A0A411HHE0_9GAMM|nr:protein translocase subunit SecD [Pseudolysobacter antarcticus]QBB69938.1 protein translocase subunit SecD [Pseudolysobacter antarcticus]
MNDFPRWKYTLIAVVIFLGLIYASPNLFQSQPAVQISAKRGATVDEALKEKVTGILQAKKIDFKAIDLNDDRLLARFADANVQLAAADALTADLNEKGEQYVIALNLASTVPQWLRAIGANAMPLGLDLQGGVHFLMEIDQKAALEKQQQRYVDDVRSTLLKSGVRYQSVNPTAAGIAVVLNSPEDQKKAAVILAQEVNKPENLGDPSPLDITDGVAGSENGLTVKVREATVLKQSKDTIASNLTTLRNRVNELGVSEPTIQQQGSSRIVVELAGVQDSAKAKKILGATATLEYRAVDESITGEEAMRTGRVPPDSQIFYRRGGGSDGKGQPVLLKKKIIATGNELVGATSIPDQQTGTPSVSVRLNAAGAKKMLDFTSQNVNHGMAVVYIERTPEVKIIDGKEVRTSKTTQEVVSVATIQSVFSSQFQTTGLGSSKEAADLALLLRAGSLAAPVDIVEERVIGPSLGQDNINKGAMAVLLGLLAVLVCAALYYHLFGLIADIALILNLVMLLALLSKIGATLTMPGIAGIVLTLGMAIDANVLICERIREELRNGLTPLASIRAGYEKAWATILDANVTHLLAAIGLLIFGSGPIKGFAVTLFLGILTSMFTSVTVTHAMVNLIHRGRKLKTLSV